MSSVEGSYLFELLGHDADEGCALRSGPKVSLPAQQYLFFGVAVCGIVPKSQMFVQHAGWR